jgi:hypothetical protein
LLDINKVLYRVVCRGGGKGFGEMGAGNTIGSIAGGTGREDAPALPV